MKTKLSFRARSARKLIIMLLFLTIGVIAKSQAFFGGVAAGAVTSQVDGDDNNGFHKAGFTAGAFVGLELSDIFDIQFEIKYIQKGSKSSADEPVSFTIKLDYIEMPLIVSANLGFININNKQLKWISLEAGASVDVLANVNQQTNGVNEIASNKWKKICFNGIIGVKFNITEKLLLGTRIITSINSVYDGNGMNAMRFGQWGAFNDVLELVLYYRFK
ncbi:MAG: PorT family protein [Bacteroidales bacterium]|nr:PorT family protein [Bacteroidales bacterium]